jgi:8-oxo-dGTP diphosphatase
VSEASEQAQEPVDVALVVPVIDGKLLVARRPEGTHLEGLWEFPGGKIDGGEEPADAARRELTEETGLVAESLDPLVVVVHEYAERQVRLHVFLARDTRGDARSHWSWKTPAEVAELPMPPANARILTALRWRLP